jgi:Ca2+-binding EF-hand superfamily protein
MTSPAAVPWVNMSHRLLTLGFLVTFCAAFALPNKDGETRRIFEKSLSDADHFIEGEHNSVYDHEAFLGDEATQFDELSPSESRRRLGLIFDKIDTNKDGFMEPTELKKWIQWTQRRFIVRDAETQWRIHNPDGKEKIAWSEYKRANYGFLEGEPEGTEDRKTYTKMMQRDRRRWTIADTDADDFLNQEEFQNFIHPEDVEHMQDVVVLETVEDIDKDGDGLISLAEYISDLYRGDPGDEEPAWVENERESFRTYRDKNKDGFLDNDEVKQWILPDQYDHAEAETNHLIHVSDSDSDGKLSKEEVLDKYDIFVGSQATDFGEALVKHDEF